MDRKYQFYFLYKEFLKKINAILYVQVFCLHVYTHTTCMPGAEKLEEDAGSSRDGVTDNC